MEILDFGRVVVKKVAKGWLLLILVFGWGAISASTGLHVGSDNRIECSFCSFEDNLKEIVTALIDAEEESIWVTAFRFTDSEVASALTRAMRRGVSVEFVIDRGCFGDRFHKVTQIQRAGATVNIYNSPFALPGSSFKPLMHNKIVLFGRNLYGRRLCMTGSLNLSHFGFSYNCENIVILDNPEIWDKFYREFERIKEMSEVWVAPPAKRKAKKS